MGKESSSKASITPLEALETLPAIEFNPEQAVEDRELGRAELLRSVLAIARLDHVAESRIVREAVTNALGRIPDLSE